VSKKGEHLRLPDPGDGWRWILKIETADDGKDHAVVAQIQREQPYAVRNAQLVSEILSLRLYRMENPPETESWVAPSLRGLLIFDRKTKATAWRSEQLRAKLARAIYTTPAHHQDFSQALPWYARLWVYQIGRADDLHLMFEVPYISQLLGDRSKHGLLHNNLDELRKLLTAWGFAVGHFQLSQQGAKQAGEDHVDAITYEAEEAALNPEACFTVLGLLVLVLHHCKGRRAAKDAEDRLALGRVVQTAALLLVYRPIRVCNV